MLSRYVQEGKRYSELRAAEGYIKMQVGVKTASGLIGRPTTNNSV